jgi:hypothetical protein
MRAIISTIATVSLCAVLGACSSSSDAPAESSTSSRFKNALFLGTSNPAPAPGSTPLPDVNCPPVEIQSGTAAYTIGDTKDAFNVRYQASLGELARECTPAPESVGLKVGVSGRLMAGPKGTTGTVIAVPVRIVLLDPEGKTAVTRLTRVSVNLPQGQAGADFTHVEDLGAVPLDANKLRGWKISVGFDGGQRR